jgi:hypothetical protein
MPIHKNIQAQASLWEYFCIFLQDKLDLFQIPFCYTRTISCHHIQGQQSYNVQGKENIKEDEEVKVAYILLSGILAVVVTLAAVNGITRSPIVDDDVRCSLYPNTNPLLYGYSLTTLHLCRCQNVVLFLF